MPLEISQLSENLQELFSAVQRTSSNDSPLVSSLFTSKIYDASCGWGRVWRWSYNILSICKCCRLDTLKERRLKEAILKTARTFQEQLPIIQEFTNKYRKYVHDASTSTRITRSEENDYTAARKAITLWNDEITPFIKLLERDARLTNLLQPYFQGIPIGTSAGFNIDARLQQDLHQCQQLINYEGHHLKTLPIDLFCKLAWFKKISTEIADLQVWVNEHKKVIKGFGGNRYHDIFRSIVCLALHPKADTRPEAVAAAVSRLECDLSKHGFTPITEPDPEQIQWRDTLHEGSKLFIGTRCFELGTEIQHKEKEEKAKNEAPSSGPEKASLLDKNKIYNIVGQPNAVLVISFNRAVAGIRQFEQKRSAEEGESGICQLAEYLDLDPEGRFAVVEKITPLSHHRWHTAESDTKIHSEDLRICLHINQLIAACLREGNEKTPRHLTTKHIGINTTDQLKCLRFTDDGPFDLNKIERFINDLAPLTHPIYTHLMTASRLTQHRSARFYHDMIGRALESQKNLSPDEIRKEASLIGACSNIEHGQIIDESVIIFQKMQEIKERHMQLLRKKGDQSPAEISKSVEKVIKSIKSSNDPWKLLLLRAEQAFQGLHGPSPTKKAADTGLQRLLSRWLSAKPKA